MKIAVMQPYIFPYIGYFHLAHSVDEFILFDDVNFIKKGYINKNAILINGSKFNFSIPVSKASQNRKINEHVYTGAFDDFIRKVENAYKKAPFYEPVLEVIRDSFKGEQLDVHVINKQSLERIFSYLGIEKKISLASTLSIHENFKGQDRILEICKLKNATGYHNAIGGKELYDQATFSDNGIELSFIESSIREYQQGSSAFEPALSIIDVLMWNDVEQCKELIGDYRLVS